MTRSDDRSPNPPSDDDGITDDALAQMIVMLRLTVETLRFMAETTPTSARPATLDAARDVETAVAKLRRAATLASNAGGTPTSDPLDRPSCH